GAAEAEESAAVWTVACATGCASALPAAGDDWCVAGSGPTLASSCSSGLFAQRQPNSATWLPLIPLVRTNVHPPQASRMAAAMTARLGLSARRRLTAAPATNARHRPGTA